ncbi:post-transcriptional regulator [Aerococcus kribbianus]|uniref:Post-transcriptional regulator n=1 Tax=Aerococcus kribbianus TaxID=2999064 RepID=A0A9X3JF02_9LACT|nr:MULTISPECIES: post-transcriptional regulator [unclassified Aerococcus]MCZ0717123.1 hypothetical protein [Aerococcus sp. YH-aer221]MCZ0725411.1 hypothetical protein [Aerococcus sp. YH-aer222]
MEISKYTLMCLRPAFRHKAREFAKQGYGHINWEDIERYFLDYAWKREKPRSLVKKRQMIKRLSANDYFDYAKLKATVYDVSPLEDMDINNLL